MTTARQVPIPDPLREMPPADRNCDLVLNGGVASGVVYPWALLHLARHYRLRSIGGNSVGAMAAVLAAAAEYGRCHGVEDAFEPLRQVPLKLAEEEGGKALMLRLFQPSALLRRLFEAFRMLVDRESAEGEPDRPAVVLQLLKLYAFWGPFGTLAVLLLLVALLLFPSWRVLFVVPLAVLSAAVLAALIVGLRLLADLRALAANEWGLCPGPGQGAGEEGLVEWLHRGIQLSAGRQREDPPLTFADLWSAPRFGRPGPAPAAGGCQPDDPGIELQVFTSNITQGRPVRLPINDPNTRLYFDEQEWQRFFPPTVLKALVAASTRYQPASPSDPPREHATPDDPQQVDRLYELPGAGMPLVVAARLSMSFPLLFSCVPVYAVDYEARRPERRLRRCLLSDGGLCTNFPVHLFDRAHPDWPTFAFLFDERLASYSTSPVWLANSHLQGRADAWQRKVPGAADGPAGSVRPLKGLIGLAAGLLLTMKDWNDHATLRLPQVRNRVIRLGLKTGEGQLNIGMSGRTILKMAHEYGTGAGIELVQRFLPDASGQPSRAWREHLYVRAMVEFRALRRHLRGYRASVRSPAYAPPLRALLDDALVQPPLRRRQPETGPPAPCVAAPQPEQLQPGPADPSGVCLSPPQREAMERVIAAIEALEAEMQCADLGPYVPMAEPELRLRPPI